MKCGICAYVAPANGTSHTARTCPLKQTQCRRTLPEGHPFRELGQCVDLKCIHNKICGKCGLPGHLYGTQTFAPDRWQHSKKGGVVRKWCKRALDKTDFVCVLITPEAIQSLVNNSQNMSAAEGVERAERRVSVARLRGNVHDADIDVNETMRVMETLGSKAAVLQGANKVAFSVLRQHAREGSVAANQRAAQAVEGDVSDAGASSGDVAADGNVDANADRERGDADVDVGAAGAADGDSSGAEAFHEPKAVRMLRGATARRSKMYAAAIAKGRSKRGAAQAPRAASVSGKGKGRAKGTNEGASPLPADETAIGLPSFCVNKDDLWPRGTRAIYARPLAVFKNREFGSLPPLQIAHRIIVQLCRCPVEEADQELASYIIKGAVQSHLRGYTLTSGSLAPADVSEWLCSAMPATMRPALLSSIAFAVHLVVAGARTGSEWEPSSSSASRPDGAAVDVADALAGGIGIAATRSVPLGAEARGGVTTTAAGAEQPANALADGDADHPVHSVELDVPQL